MIIRNHEIRSAEIFSGTHKSNLRLNKRLPIKNSLISGLNKETEREINKYINAIYGGTALQFRKVVCSIPDGVIVIFH